MFSVSEDTALRAKAKSPSTQESGLFLSVLILPAPPFPSLSLFSSLPPPPPLYCSSFLLSSHPPPPETHRRSAGSSWLGRLVAAKTRMFLLVLTPSIKVKSYRKTEEEEGERKRRRRRRKVSRTAGGCEKKKKTRGKTDRRPDSLKMIHRDQSTCFWFTRRGTRTAGGPPVHIEACTNYLARSLPSYVHLHTGQERKEEQAVKLSLCLGFFWLSP